MKKIIVILVVCLFISPFFIIGCGSQIVSIDEATKHWVGRPIKELKEILSRRGSYASRIGWKEKNYPLANGNWVYVEPDSNNCFVHWEVNPNGIIVGYKLEGDCH